MNGHLLRCRCACFAKREERTVASAIMRRSALSGAHVQTQYAPLRFSRRLVTGAFLNRLKWLYPEMR
jgi:hypothetical protein